MKWYEQMARTVSAYNSCIRNDNKEWEERHKETIDELIKYLPHGSGIDNEWKIDSTKHEVLSFSNSFHAMDEQGGYCGWIDFTVKIYPSLQFGTELNILGKFGKKQGIIKDYLYEIIDIAINETIKDY